MRNVEIVSLANVSGYTAVQVHFELLKGTWTEMSVYGGGTVISESGMVVGEGETSRSVSGILCSNCFVSKIEKCTFAMDGTVIGEGCLIFLSCLSSSR